MRIYTDLKNLTCRFLNTDGVIRWRLILVENGQDIEHIKVEKYMVDEKLSRIPLNGNQETTQKFTYAKEIVSEFYDIKKLTEDVSPY